MKKLMITVVAAVVAAVTAKAGVTTSGKNITVSGTGNDLSLSDAEAQVTVENSASVNLFASKGETVMMQEGSTVSLGDVSQIESWRDKALLWVSAMDADSIKRTWTGNYVELWRDCRHPDTDCWALGNYRRSGSAVPSYATTPTYANVDFHNYQEWGSRLKIFKVVNDEPTTNKVANGVNDPVSTTVPSDKVKHVIMVFGSQYGGGLGLMNNMVRGGDISGKAKPTYTNAIFAANIGTVTKNGTWVDGVKVDPTTTGFNGGWQLLSFKADFALSSDWKLGNYYSSNSGWGGGQRYAEVLFFTNDLTEVERVAAEKTIAKKYNLGYVTEKLRLFGEGAVTLSEGAAEVGGKFSGTLNVAAGASVNFTDTKAAPTAPTMTADITKMAWHDPSQASSISYGNPSASLDCLKQLSIGNLSNPSLPLTGGIRSAGVFQQAVALGPTYNWLTYVNETGNANNGKMMRWKQDEYTGEYNTRAGFMVLDTRHGAQTLFLDDSVYIGPRFDQRTAVSDPIFKTKSGYSQLTTNSPAYLNGIQVDAGTHNFNSRGEVISFNFCESVPIKNLNCYGNTSSSFYLVHGEAIFYTDPLDEADRKDTEAYLMNKWLGITPAGYGDMSGATIAGAGDVTFANAEHPGFAADYSGDIDASAATTLNFTYDSDGVVNPIQTTGELTLADAITVDVDFKTIPSAFSGTIVLAKGATLTGGATVTLTEASKSYFESASLTLADNQLTLTYERSKLLCWRVTGLTAMQQAEFDHAELVVNEGMGLKVLTGEVAYDTIASTKLTDYTGSEYRFEIRYYNVNGIAIGISPTYTYAELQDYIEGSAGSLEPETYASGSYTLPRADWTELGYSFAQQLTNAVALAANGATITILPNDAAYDLGAVYMNETSYNSSDTTPVVVKSHTHIYVPNKVLHFVGDTTAHWSGAVTLTGSGRFFMNSNNGETTFEGITFKGFTACDNPGKMPASGNLYAWSLGGAICGSAKIVATNCVFEGCSARSAGAVAYITSRDCKYKENSAKYNGGAMLYGYTYGCRFEGNYSTDNTGAIWWPYGLEDSEFIGNHAVNGSGAIICSSSATYRNLRFEGNYAQNSAAGAVTLCRWTTLTNCVFVGNYAKDAGGAVYGDDTAVITRDITQGGYGSKFIDCIFSNNYTTAANSRAGAVSAIAHYTDSNKQTHYPKTIDFIGCSFVGNHAGLLAGAAYGGTFTNCTFEANYLAGGTYNNDSIPSGGAIYGEYTVSNGVSVIGCAFASNHIESVSNAWGVAIYCATRGWKCENNVFDGNYLMNVNASSMSHGKIVYTANGGDYSCRMANCLFTNNVVCCGGIVNNAIVTNTVFVGNDVPTYGACVISSEVCDSTFIDNRRTDRHRPSSKYTNDKKNYSGAINSGEAEAGVDATSSKLYRCTMDGGIYNQCVINECVIPKCNSYGTWCVFSRGNYVTNTLIAGAGGDSMRSLIYRWGMATSALAKSRSAWYNEFVNCTFADNVYVGANGTAQRFAVCGYRHDATNRTVKTKLINCVFNNNRAGSDSGEIVDLSTSVGKASGVDPSVYGDVLLVSNCVFGVAAKVVSGGNDYGYDDLGGNQVVSAAAQRLLKSEADMTRYHCSVKYTPKGNSPLRGAGDASFYADDAKDLAGNKRVDDGGKVDIGCYQSYLPRYGTLIFAK